VQEPVIQWGAIALFSSIVIGSLLINLGLRWRAHQRRRTARGFRNMKSVGQHHRDRTRVRSEWQQPVHRPSQRAGGWR